MVELRDVTNIGKELEGKLREVGIESYDELMVVGSEEAFKRIKAIDNTACFNMLCALEGAIQGVRWHSLTQETKDRLKKLYQTL